MISLIPKEDNNDERAVSPVIGVILMVAITVILAAVIAVFVLDLGEQIDGQAPSISFSCDGTTAVVQGGQTGFDGKIIDAADDEYTSLTAGDELNGTGNIVWESDNGQNSAILFEGCN